ncbi:MAG: acyltransferase [Promethearchaeota archaeon]
MSSTPVSLLEGIITTNTLPKKRYVAWYVLMIWISALPPVWIVLRFFNGKAFNDPFTSAWVIFMVPILIMLLWLLWVVCAILISRVFLSIAILLHKPREGVFDRDPKDKGYKYWAIRGTIRKFGVWAAHSYPLPWLDTVAFKVLGVKQRGGGTAFFDCWVDSEFLEVGDNAMFGLGSCIMTSMVAGDKLLIKGTKIGARTLIGAGAVVAPGTVVGDDCVLGSLSTTSVGQVLEDGWIYTGVPCRKFRENDLKDRLHYKETDVVRENLSEEDVQNWYGSRHLNGKGDSGKLEVNSSGAPAGGQDASEKTQ